MTYTYAVEAGHENVDELLPLYAAHYAETAKRLKADGLNPSSFAPDLPRYKEAWRLGYLLNYVVRHEGAPVAVSNVYITRSMHDGQIIATEDSIYVTPEHRGRVGKQLVRFILDDLAKRSVNKVFIDAVTDLRVAKIWRRMGFKDYATRMVMHLGEN